MLGSAWGGSCTFNGDAEHEAGSDRVLVLAQQEGDGPPHEDSAEEDASLGHLAKAHRLRSSPAGGGEPVLAGSDDSSSDSIPSSSSSPVESPPAVS
ncbi:hypothetical protein L484_027432 [Morus notabilis]|uniref:Uncharacterized protein n=1 Tax=Morus notabilis TaxID=981085 RepID=W9S623_9ROSA|nr:hypothetical protein L484_027432 [Morus notabilis]